MNKLFSSLFLITFIAYVAFAAIEEFIPGFVSDYFNPQVLMVLPLGFLLATLLVEAKTQKETTRESHRPRSLLIFLSSLVTVAILLIAGRELAGVWRILVAVFGGVVVAGMLTVLLKE